MIQLINGQANQKDSTKRKSINGQLLHEEMFNILRHKGNANQNYIEMLSHLSQNGNHKNKQHWMLARVSGKRNPYTLLVGIKISAAPMEISMAGPQKSINKQNYHIILLYHSWAYIWRNASQHTIDKPVQWCLYQHYSQKAHNGISLGVHKAMTG
jgi:hypothetical protein